MQRKGNKPKIYSNISNKLHSIPKLKKNVKSNVVYSIPCATVLALLSGLFFNLVFSNNACYAESTVTLNIDTNTITGNVVPDTTIYKSSNVTYSASNIENYSLNISYANGSNGLTLEGSTDTLPNVDSDTVGSNISNAWGYAWGDTTADNTSLVYNPMPAYGNAKSIESNTTSTGNIASITKKIVFAANFSDSNPNGHYKTNVLLSLVATPKATTYTLTFNTNGGSGGTTTKTCTTYGTSCTISLSDVTAPARTNYTFLGWADSNNAASATYTTSSTITMNRNEIIYAVWQLDDPWANITTMQQMTTAACNAASVGKTKTLTDSRDSSTYTIEKLADKKCWMTQNLHLKLSAGTTLTPADTNVSVDWTPTNNTLSSLSATNFSSVNSGYYKVESYIAVPNTEAGYTGYYSYAAATAGTTGYTQSNGTNTTIQSSGTASGDICPKGWRLPTGGPNGEFKTLHNAAAITTTNITPFSYTGYIAANASIQQPTITGRWWSSTIAGDSSAYLMIVSISTINSTENYYRYYGYAIRCVAR